MGGGAGGNRLNDVAPTLQETKGEEEIAKDYKWYMSVMVYVDLPEVFMPDRPRLPDCEVADANCCRAARFGVFIPTRQHPHLG